MDNCYYEKVGDKTTCINEEIPFEIPNNWTWCRLGNYAHIITDYVASGSFASLNENVQYYKEENYAILLRTCDFKGDFSSGLVYTDKHGYDFLKNSNLFGGEIILSNIGASIGKVFIVPRLNKRMTLAPNSIMVNLFDDTLNEFIYFLFLSSPYQNKLHDISVSSAQAKFNKTDFKKIIIPIPPLSQQKLICDTLKKLTLKISNISQNFDSLKNNIELLRAKILDDIFGENSRYKSYYTHYGTLSDFGTLISGRDLKPDEYNDDNNGVPYLTGASNFENDTVIINRWTPFPVVLSLENDVLITCKGTIGKTAINKIKKCHIARQIMAFRCNEKVLPEFLKLYFEYMTTTLQKASSSLIPGITRSIMLSLNIAFPPIEKQQEIIENTQKIMLILESIIS